MTELLSDIRFGWRMVRKRPGTSALAVVALALGIGLTTTMFSIIQGAILRGLPFPGAERIVYVGRFVPGQGDGRPGSTSFHDLADWRASQQSFEALSGFAIGNATVTGGDSPQQYRRARVTPNTLRLLRVAPALGRDFMDADAMEGAEPVVMLGHEVWTNQFGRDPGIVGRTVRVNGQPTTVIGVMPPKFGYPNVQQLWTPLPLTLAAKRGDGGSVDVVGRLRTDTTIAAASTEMAEIGRRLREKYLENKDVHVAVIPFVERSIGPQIVTTFYSMLVAVFGVMLIACANVANLQLARAAERTRELAMRLALGAGRARIVRQLLVEGLLLSAAGALLGLGIAYIGTALFSRAIVDTAPPFWIDVRLDPTVLLFATVLTVISALAASLIPALRATRQDINVVLKDEGRGNTGLHMGRFSRSLVIVEMLLSCCLLIVSGLMIKGVVSLGQLTYPYATADVFAGGITAQDAKYPDNVSKVNLLDQITSTISMLPGVRAAALASGTPENSGSTALALEGATYTTPKDQPSTRRTVISSSYFDVLRVAIVRGRAFTAADRLDVTPVAIVSEDLAAKHFAGKDAIGRRIRLGSDPKSPWLTIVGIVPPLSTAATQGTREMTFVPLNQAPQIGVTVFVSTLAPPLSLAAPIRAAIQRVDEDLALGNPRTIASQYYENNWHYRVFGALFMSFGAAALLLASAGLYGVMAFSVRRRTNEIGVRMALGANRGSIVRLILLQGLWRCVLGVALGLLPAWWLGNAMKELLFSVEAFDPVVWGLTITGLMTAGLLASLIPALRAAAVDPLVALRSE